MEREHTSVWIIEATGKIGCLSKVLSSLGYVAEIIATRGHFCKMPDSLSDVAIDKNFHETDRIPDPVIVERIRTSIKIMLQNGGNEVYIATDDDAEGNVIAYDVFETIKDIFPNPKRVKLTALDKDSIMEALSTSGEVLKSEAIPGRTRAIIDRLIGASFASHGLAAGRVGSAILGIIAKDKPKPYRLDLYADALDGGRPWRASTELNNLITKDIAEQLTHIVFPPLDYAEVKRKIIPPNDMGRILVRAGDTMNLSPKDAAKALQAAYESGSLSYPRAASRGMSKAASLKLSKSLKQTGWKFDKSCIPDRTEGEPHDSPYPIGPVDVSLDPKKIGPGEGIRVMVARDLVPCGEKRRVEKHKKGIIDNFLIQKGFSKEVSDFIDNLDWERDFGQPVPGESENKQSQLVQRRIDSVILESCLKHDIGKPSTWPNHIQNFIDKGLVDENLDITQLGQEFINRTPAILMNPVFSQAIMKACDMTLSSSNGEPWEALAKKIVNALPGNIKDKMNSVTVESTSDPALEAEKAKILKDFGV